MSRFRKLPVEIEAEQFTTDTALRMLIDREPGPFGLRSASGNYHPADRTISYAWISITTIPVRMITMPRMNTSPTPPMFDPLP